jgi:hypothetical protein
MTIQIRPPVPRSTSPSDCSVIAPKAAASASGGWPWGGLNPHQRDINQALGDPETAAIDKICRVELSRDERKHQCGGKLAKRKANRPKNPADDRGSASGVAFATCIAVDGITVSEAPLRGRQPGTRVQ